METKLQLCFFFVCHCDTYFITSPLPYLYDECGYVFLMTLALRYIFMRSNYLQVLQFKKANF